MKKSETFISIILILDNHADQLEEYIQKVSSFLEPKYSDYEIVLIDQCSSDNTEIVMSNALGEYQSIRYLRLAQRVPDDVALAAGIENAIGDFVINLNIESDNCEVIDLLVDKAKSGTDIVVGTSTKVSSSIYKTIRKLSRRLLSTIGYTLPENSTGTFCISRRAVNAITESGRFYCKLHMRMANIGYPVAPVEYEVTEPSKAKKSILTGIQESLHHMVFNSTKPLRWMSFIGIVGSSFAMLFSAYSLIVNLLNDRVAEGWTTTILFMSFLFTLLFLMLSFFGEYLARLLDDRSEHKEYNVVFEKNSSVMLEENRNNVLFESTSNDINLVQSGRDK